MTRDEAERLLDGTGAGEVSGVLARAASEGTRAELAREDTPAAMFSASRLTPSTPHTKEAVMTPTPLRRLVSAKAALVVVAVLFGSTGVALAATSSLPWQASPRAVEATSAQATDDETTESDDETIESDDETDDADETTETTETDDTTDTDPADGADGLPGAKGLCTAYFAGDKGEHGDALESPAFLALVDEAGGEERVASYCAALGVEPREHSGKPADAGKPADTGKPADAGKPADTGKPADAGKPADTGKPADAGKPAHAGKPAAAHG